MSDFKFPRRDQQFLLRDVFDYDAHIASMPDFAEVTPDLIDAVLDAGIQMSEDVVAPTYATGDAQGCTWSEDGVTTPDGYKEAYDQYLVGGWAGVAAEPEYGGQGLPPSLGLIVNELTGTANWAFSMYPGLSASAINCVRAHGSEEQKNIYMPPMVEGRWTGTMCLTESHCGSDLGLLRTKAKANPDGTYSITGTKIFISAGEHDLTENIVHLVIARVEGAPSGTAGISLFIVPKNMINEDGTIGERNAVSCGAIEHKMGIHGNATCVINFDEATGYLVGEENKGLANMFTMMNTARVGTALQGVAHAEQALQKSVAYARERLSMRSLSGPKNPDGPADPIVVHPDVRRLILEQKSFVEGGRAFMYWLNFQIDLSNRGTEEEAAQANTFLEFLTPIAKAFLTEIGFESVNNGLQIFGGHGYIAEHGMEQIVRDHRISMLYEGTTGIQAIDLLGRKVMGTGGKSLAAFTKVVHQFCKAEADNDAMAEFTGELSRLNGQWGELTAALGEKAMQDADEVGAASVDYLMYGGYVVMAYFWAMMAKAAQQKLDAGEGDAEFYQAKIETARFYYQRMLPRTATHVQCMQAGAGSLMAMTESQLYMG